MYKIKSVKINNFWYRNEVIASFEPDVNIIIGRNGTGKTTFLNILHAVLTVDIDILFENDFDSVTIELISEKNTKTMKVTKKKEVSSLWTVEYNIANKTYEISVADEERGQSHFIRREREASENIRSELEKLVSLSSLSVYRLTSSHEYEIRGKMQRKRTPPVDYRLSKLLQYLTRYHLKLSLQEKHVSENLQKDVLTSILYNSTEKSDIAQIFSSFNGETESEKLISAYSQLRVMDEEVKKKIHSHVNAIKDALSIIDKEPSTNDKLDETINMFTAIESLKRTKNIIDFSLKAELKNKEILLPITLFFETLKEFITDKKFNFENGSLMIQAGNEDLSYEGLSSGEKQLLIILIETLLQDSKPYIFLTDEPELSLHIEWQRQIIPAILKLNPNAQIIAATHSPEVASHYQNSILNMVNLISNRKS